MSCLFDPFRVGPLDVKNRFVRSATGESRADKEGVIKDEMIPIYEELAAGGVGLIISGHMYVHKDWKCSPLQTGNWDEKHLPGLQRLAQAATQHGTRAVAQINYATRAPADMSPEEIREAEECFVAAAGRAVEAGFDGVQVHAAHGYLVSCFLTPSENKRDDAYGDGPEARRALLIRIAARTRERIGRDKALLCKLGSVDGRDNSLPLEETVATAHALEAAGVDAIEVSSTLTGEHAHPAAEGIDAPEKEAYFAPQAAAIKHAVGIPVILVGGLRSLQVMERAVHEGTCDMVSLCRPLVREPDLVNAFREGRTTQAACISCNKCFNPRGFKCVFNA